MTFNRKLMDMREDPVIALIRDGRNYEQQVECIDRSTCYGEVWRLRNGVLWANGIRRIGRQAKYVVITGCYGMFYYPIQTLAFLNTLEKLSVDYTLLKKEYCCGFPLIEANDEEEKAVPDSKRLTKINVAEAERLGADNVILFCVWCAYLYNQCMPVSNVHFQYYPDILFEILREKKPKLQFPGRVGYYEGCHTRNRVFAPDVNLHWENAREILDLIDGLEVVDLKNKNCCIRNHGKVLREIRELELATVVTSCISCHFRLARASNGEFETKFLSEIICEALV